MNQTKELPDITSQPFADANQNLKWVGMEKIGLPVKLRLANADIVSVSASVDIFVSLDTNVKGIHMSRLYLKLNEQLTNQVITLDRLEILLDSLLASHEGISDSAMVKFSFDLLLKKEALLSDNTGYQVYPIVIKHQRSGLKPETWVEMTVPYSSTCPCSAALARQLIAASIDEQFPQDNMDKADLLQWLSSNKNALATPHNQRSYVYIKMQMTENQLSSLDGLICQFENVIGTPVQTAVKREDEQEFARLNGNNLMFCEDAARRIRGFLNTLDFVADYWFKVEHQESLHAHNAVVIDQKNTLKNYY